MAGDGGASAEGAPVALRRRRGRLVVAGVVVLVVVAAAVGVGVALRGPGRPVLDADRTTMSGTDMLRSLGAAIAERGSGRAVTTNAGTRNGVTVRFTLRQGWVDGIVTTEPEGVRSVVKGGVTGDLDGPPRATATPGAAGLPSVPGSSTGHGLGELVSGLPLQGADPQGPVTVPPGVVWTRVASGPAGTQWTASSTLDGMIPEAVPVTVRTETRLSVDPRGLPVEVRVSSTYTLGGRDATVVAVTRYDQWGEPVDVPEPPRSSRQP